MFRFATSFQPIMSFFWNHVIIFAETANHILAAIFDFRVWERRRIGQNITLVVPRALIHKITAQHKEILFVTTTMAEKLRNCMATYRNIDNTLSSVDLQTCS